MKKIIVNENQKGLLFYGGKFAGLLNAGRYRVSGSKEIEIVSQDQPLYSRKCSLETLLSDRAVAGKTYRRRSRGRRLSAPFCQR